VKRITKAALGGLAGCAMIIGASQAANGEPSLEFYSPPGDLVVMSSSAFDNAVVTLDIKEAPDATNFKITVEKIDTSTANAVHGAHLHNGPCPEKKDRDTDTTLGHYKHDSSITFATSYNEVWFDLETNVFGVATASTTVKFVPVDKPFSADPDPGEMSIVIHENAAALPTSMSAKLACFPLDVTDAPRWI